MPIGNERAAAQNLFLRYVEEAAVWQGSGVFARPQSVAYPRVPTKCRRRGGWGGSQAWEKFDHRHHGCDGIAAEVMAAVLSDRDRSERC